uniref:Uncharacterized protein n=1 Tax=Chromera velia CCMP2878 TaxID=1169474 RepID=A0A0G4GNV9_9ALVE|eukprot:Cvel_22716.t1-p1 / transcript=Cvel_22716.t1 / gene=Cvel_22716 / organism=Chromera_velia_CCMP2878 / gene_product=hypothetical protein / transcript_product=hypothetical protein / location=Cvel_scaffold2263:13862-18319(+) / protein_length=95 / sequence_SO=supercontig / SO=protein_coding / is_pseudo=false
MCLFASRSDDNSSTERKDGLKEWTGKTSEAETPGDGTKEQSDPRNLPVRYSADSPALPAQSSAAPPVLPAQTPTDPPALPTQLLQPSPNFLPDHL